MNEDEASECAARRIARVVREQIKLIKRLAGGPNGVGAEDAHLALLTVERECDDIIVAARHAGPIGGRP